MARKPLMAGNWKMNNTYAEAVVLAQTISNNFDKHWADSVDVLVCPPSIDLKPVNTVFEFDHQPIQIGAQNVYWEPKGAFTGEVSAPMLKDVHCTCSIVGHSERRGYFGETNEEVNRKVRALLDGGLYAVACVGESLSVRDEGGVPRVRLCPGALLAFAGLSPRRPPSVCAGAHLGHRHGPQWPRPSRRRTYAPPSAPRSPTCSAPRPPMRCASCMAVP